MQSVFGCLPVHDTTQVLVNLGLVHRGGEWVPYWEGWIEWMRTQGWRRFGWYVWDRLESVPGDHNGRLAPAHEWVFHFHRVRRYPNKTVACKRPGEVRSRDFVQRAPNGMADPRRGIRTTAAYHAAYTDPGELIYDPFVGSGTSILAAEQGGRVCYAMELEPSYCDIAVQRWEAWRAKGAPVSKATPC